MPHRNIYKTLENTYMSDSLMISSLKFEPIRENWEGAPTMKNFTGCGGCGWNQNKSPCQNNQNGRWSNNCRTVRPVTLNAGMQPANWLPF